MVPENLPRIVPENLRLPRRSATEHDAGSHGPTEVAERAEPLRSLSDVNRSLVSVRWVARRLFEGMKHGLFGSHDLLGQRWIRHPTTV
jgi:hypothetical protein